MSGNFSPESSGIVSPELDRLYTLLYERRLNIYQASAGVNPDVDPSEFVCSGGASTYFEQPIDPEKREMLRDLYNSVSLTRQMLLGRISLTPEDTFYTEQLEWELSLRRELLDNTEYRKPIDGTAWSTVPQFLQDAAGTGRYAMQSYDDFEHSMNRIKGFALWADMAMHTMREGIAAKDTMPQILGARALRSMDGYLEDNARGLKNIFLNPLAAANMSTEFSRAYSQVVEKNALAVFVSLADFMRHEYLPHCRSDEQPGLFYAPDGKIQYERMVRYHTSNDTTIAQIEAISEEDYHQSLDKLKLVAQKLGFASPGALRRFILSDTTPHSEVRPFTDVEQAIERYHHIARRVQQGLPRVLLGEDMPSDNWAILPVTDHTASTTPATYSNGIFRMPIEDITRYNTADMHKFFMHEVNPGHHVQLEMLQNMQLPHFLRYSNYPAVREGWAMYAETLADELGAPYSDWEMAARLCSKVSTAALGIADIGVHHKGWSLSQARRFADEHIPGNDQSQEDLFLVRNIIWPAQNHAYTFGESAMHAMRDAAVMQMGKDFDVRIFHNALLRSGEKPLSMLRDLVFYKLGRHSAF